MENPVTDEREPVGDERQKAFPVSEEAFIEELWNLYYDKLKFVVAGRVQAMRRPVANESEIALSAFHSFVQRARTGQFPDLVDQDAIWNLLRTIAIRKANTTRKHLLAKKRGGHCTIMGQSDSADPERLTGVDAAIAAVDPPSLDVEVSDLLNSLLAKLPDQRHRDVVLLKLEGTPVTAIADCLETSTRTVQRILKQIETRWKAELS